MIEIRLHGRGGQGVVVASEIIATAFFIEGKYPQSFPMFGVERRGAPVTAFVRVDKNPIHLRTEIYKPDHLIILDPTLLSLPAILNGLKHGGLIVINCKKEITKGFDLASFKLAYIDANSIAKAHNLGTTFSPIVNTAITGAFAKASCLVKISSVIQAIREIVKENTEANVEAARQSYEKTICQEK